MILRKLLVPLLAVVSLAPAPAIAQTYRHHYNKSAAHRRYVRHRRHRTIRRVGIGAAGGAAIGALAGGGKGAGIGAIAGAGAGALYDQHKRHQGR
jgi:outer membrane lipoprotein SlyB